MSIKKGNSEIVNKIREIFIAFLILLIFSSLSFSQEFKGYVLAKGTARFDKRPISDAVAHLYKNGTKIESKNAATNGKFEFKLDHNNIYTIEVEAADLVSKRVEINTALPDSYKEEILQYKFVTELFEMMEGLDISALKDPVSKIKYNTELDKFEFDSEYTQVMRKKIEAVERQLKVLRASKYAEVMATAKKLFNEKKYEEAITYYDKAIDYNPYSTEPDDMIFECEDRLREMGNDNAAFNRLIAAGDRFFAAGSFKSSKTSFEKALDLNPDEQYPKDKLDEINKILEEEGKAEGIDRTYTSLITKADSYFKMKKYESAKENYEKALELKPDDTYPKGKIDQINQILAQAKSEEESIKKNEEEYLRTVANADKLYDQKKLKEARVEYEKASKLTSKKYPLDMIDDIDDELKYSAELEAESKKNEEEYQREITTADGAFNSKDYTNAIKAYQSASRIKPDEDYPTDKIKECNKLIAEQKTNESAEKAKELAYNKEISNGDTFFNTKRYEQAKESYNNALGLKPDEVYPKGRITEIDKLLADKAKAAADAQAMDKAYNDAIASADASLKAEKYDEAKSSYNSALGIKPGEKYPTDKITEIDKLLADKAKSEADAKAKDDAYNQAISTADASFTSKSYDAAKKSYNDALKIKPAESYPKTKLAEIDKLLADIAKSEADAQAKDKAYNDAIASADASFKAEKYDEAKSSYNSALGIKPSESYPKTKLTEIDKLLADKAKAAADAKAKEESYKKAIAAADASFNSGKYSDSRNGYNNALSIKPGEKYPTDKITEIDKLLADKAKAEADAKAKDDAYNQAISTADASFNSKSYDAAKKSYNDALKIKPAESYPKTKLAEIEKTLLNIAKAEAAAKAKDEEYNSTILAADALLTEEKYDEAKKGYNKALGIKPNEKYPKDKIAAIDKLLADKAAATEAAAEAEKEANYQKAISNGDGYFKQLKYSESMAAYNKALTIKPDQPYPTNKIKEISAIMKNQKDAEENYKAALTRALSLFKEEKWNEAKAAYSEASAIKPAENFPKDKIAEINRILDKEKAAAAAAARNAKLYTETIGIADAAFNKKDYQTAQNKYKLAMSYKPKETYPHEKLLEIEEILKATELKDMDKLSEEEKEQYLNELSKNYPEGITTENHQQAGKKIKRVIVNYGGIAIEYRQVSTNYGTFYFKNGKSISSTLFYKETKE